MPSQPHRRAHAQPASQVGPLQALPHQGLAAPMAGRANGLARHTSHHHHPKTYNRDGHGNNAGCKARQLPPQPNTNNAMVMAITLDARQASCHRSPKQIMVMVMAITLDARQASCHHQPRASLQPDAPGLLRARWRLARSERAKAQWRAPGRGRWPGLLLSPTPGPGQFPRKSTRGDRDAALRSLSP